MEVFKELSYNGYTWRVSNFGNVKHLDCDLNRKLAKNSSGYSSFSKYNKIYLIHRMVGLAFIPNPENKKFINHKDGNKQNNHTSNLEWVTKKENEYHSINILGTKRNISGLKANWLNNVGKIKIDLFSPNGNFIKTFDSLTDCAKYLNVVVTAVNNCLKGRSNSVVKHKVKYHTITKQKTNTNY